MLNVLEIERFAVHDGPGIRTVVFLKGCALHCPWCANPESQPAAPSLLHDAKKCVACGACAAACPNGAVVQPQQGAVPQFVRTACKGCGACAAACVQEAITLNGKQMSVQSVAEECLSDADYYAASGGGVTFSGGEAMLQAAQLLPLLQQLHKCGVHIAVETCGQFSPENLAMLLPYIDLFLFDVKHADAQKLQTVTGANATLVAQNLDAITASGTQTIARIPVIPQFNHTMAEMQAIFAYCVAHGVHNAQLLPYHTLGKGKYEKLGLPYTMPLTMLQKADIAPYETMAKQCGMQIVPQEL